MQTSYIGREFIKKFEGFRPYWYDDATGEKWDGGVVKGFLTIGDGTRYDSKRNDLPALNPDTRITEEQADAIFKKDLKKFEDIVNRKVNVRLNQSQFDALVSHAYNTGGSDNLFKLVNGQPVNYGGKKWDLKNWWEKKYITSQGVPMKGLERRRKAEYLMYSSNKIGASIGVMIALLTFILILK